MWHVDCPWMFDACIYLLNKSLTYIAAQNVRALFAFSTEQIFLYISLRNKNCSYNTQVSFLHIINYNLNTIRELWIK